jgi:hypothetical protein
MSFSACSTAPGKVKFIEPARLPASYTAEVQGCEWDGDTTYQGLVNHVKRLQQCLEKYKQLLKQIKDWDQAQTEAMQKKKKELGIE